MGPKDKRTLWLRWVGANAFGEMFGLGLTLGIGGLLISRLGNEASMGMIAAAFFIAVASGAIEATILGLAQWWAMHPWFPGISRRTWWLATLAGALIAYVMGYLPSTLMSLGEQTEVSASPPAEPAQWMVLLLAAGLGLVGGAVLSFAQWLVMRKSVLGARVWIPANMLAWMVGMPLIFVGIDIAQRLSSLLSIVLFMGGVLFIAGLVVGAIHGAFLVRLAVTNEKPHIAETGSIIFTS